MVLFWVLLQGLDLMDWFVLCSSILGAPRTLLCKLVVVAVVVVVVVVVFLVRFTFATHVTD